MKSQHDLSARNPLVQFSMAFRPALLAFFLVSHSPSLIEIGYIRLRRHSRIHPWKTGRCRLNSRHPSQVERRHRHPQKNTHTLIHSDSWRTGLGSSRQADKQITCLPCLVLFGAFGVGFHLTVTAARGRVESEALTKKKEKKEKKEKCLGLAGTE